MGTIRLVVDGRDQRSPLEAPITTLPRVLADKDKRFWLDISDPTDADVELLRSTFGFHELSLEEVEKRHIVRSLAYNGGNRSKTAKALGISRATLYEKLHKFGLS